MYKKWNYFDIINTLELTLYPPGGNLTLDFWIEETKICEDSIILDICCSTGLFSRYLNKKTNCFGYGIDIDPKAVNASKNLATKGYQPNLEYYCQDAHYPEFENIQFTHMMVGNGFAFLKDKELALNNLLKFLKKGGYFLVNIFYYNDDSIDETLINKLNEICGLCVEKDYDYEYWTSLFQSKLILEMEATLNTSNYYTDCDYFELQIDEVLNDSEIYNQMLESEKSEIRSSFKYARQLMNENQRYLDSKIQIWKKP